MRGRGVGEDGGGKEVVGDWDGGGGGEGVAGSEERGIVMSLFAAEDSVTVTCVIRPSAERSLRASVLSFFGLRAASAAA